jgi:hypothetical protein
MARLIKTIEEIQQYASVSNGLQMQTIAPALNETETDVLEFYLGKDLFAEMVAQYEAGTGMTPRIAAIFPAAQRALACLGIYNASEELEVIIGENGITRMESDHEKTAFGGQVSRVKTRLGNRGWAAIDQLLQTLEDYELDYPEWSSSAYYAEKSRLLFSSALDFHRFESIKRSPLTFRAMFTYLRDLQELSIAKALPAAMYQALFESPEDPENMQLLNLYIKPALAKFCMYQALQELPVEVDHEGVMINQLELSGADSRTRKIVPNQFIERKMAALAGKGKAYMADMAEYLNEEASETKYPLWYNSKFYDEPLSKKIAENKLSNDQRNIYRA